ncbi:CU044_5270 family protein [Micromonospora phytophila]|uniref:CU044_5270 family protein n=1 Tax=Micromonospora phytophila TaxID=709888 RepID=UPI00202E47BC|nr:CU044_5270 family protein [Micromonospora phytophila]MCM0673251.1 CU044_5270 family protein [Micromonospora phytophila]
MSHRDSLLALADARPRSLDPSGPPADPALIMAHSRQESATRPARRPVRRLLLAGALPAVALAATGAILLNNTSGPGTPVVQPTVSSPAPVDVPADASLLLVAAERSESAPATAGRYWVVRAEHGEGARRLQDELWLAAVPGLPSASYVRSADGGSWASQPMQGHTADNNFLLAGSPRPARELAALPTDPAKLKKKLLTWYADTGAAEGRDEFLFYSGAAIVLDLPVSPQVRAAAYRMLAAMPGVTSLGRVTDRLGRPGVAVAVTRQGDFAKAQTRLIVDPATGQALAQETWVAGSPTSYTAVISGRWSDDGLPEASALR